MNLLNALLKQCLYNHVLNISNKYIKFSSIQNLVSYTMVSKVWLYLVAGERGCI